MVFPIPDETEQKALYAELCQKAQWHRDQGRKIVIVQGLGFVGFAVAAVIANATDSSGHPLYFVIGVELPTADSYWKVGKLNDGLTPIVSPDPELPRLIHESVHERKNLYGTVSEQAYSLADIIVVDVPLDVIGRSVQKPEDIQIDIESFKAAVKVIGRFMRHDALVLIETTVPFGTCEQIASPILKEERLQRGISNPFYLAHAYERVMPGPNYVDSIRLFWRNFAGIDKASTEKAREFLASFIDTDSYPLCELESTVSSELAKLLENSYRAVNIAFIHEWTLLAEQAGINLFAVIDSIRVRKGTHDNIRFPGFGVGGYCLTKDSLLAQWAASNLFETDVVLGMTMDALNINYKMPLHTFDLLDKLAVGGLKGKTIAVCGISYLPEIPDTRNSPTELLVKELLKAGANVVIYDPCISKWPEMQDIPLAQNMSSCLEQAEGIVFTIPHKVFLELSPKTLLDSVPSPPFIVDAQNILSDDKANFLHDHGCQLFGVGKGHWRKLGYQWKKQKDGVY